MLDHAKHVVDGFFEVLFHEVFPHAVILRVMNGISDAVGKSPVGFCNISLLGLSNPGVKRGLFMHFAERLLDAAVHS